MPFPPPQPSVKSESECAICHEQLLIAGNDDPLTPSYVIDDVELSCKHHFHQSCIFKYAASSADARERCAVCRAKVSDSNGGFWVTVRTENGFVCQIDLGRDIDEQAYLKTHPDVERAQLFLSLMSQLEFEDAETMLKGEEELGDGRPLDPNVTYETGGTTAMHMAALNDDTEGVRLLLKYGADKGFKDEDGKTALDMAKLVDGQAWSDSDAEDAAKLIAAVANSFHDTDRTLDLSMDILSSVAMALAHGNAEDQDTLGSLPISWMLQILYSLKTRNILVPPKMH